MNRAVLSAAAILTLSATASADSVRASVTTDPVVTGPRSLLNPRSVSVNFQNGVINTTSGITAFATTGEQMAGMRVTAFFTGGGSEVVTWGATGAGAGGAFGAGWSLAQSGDSFSSAWTLSSTAASIDRLLIDAGPGDTVFDTSYFGFFGTDGSAFGRDFTVTGGTGEGLDIIATYRNAVALTGDAPVGDLFRLLDIDFFTSGVAFGPDRTLTFLADTDNLLFAGDIRPIPLPTAAGLAAFGMGAVSGASRRRTR
ncbi:MAG: hypothetical protein KF684_01370 [Phycisphaeraceae bacterium]|nr:hypothetical protein [Phycisphaeraceae bacterium]